MSTGCCRRRARSSCCAWTEICCLPLLSPFHWELYRADAVKDGSDSQQRLRMRQELEQLHAVLGTDLTNRGFVGFAANLVHLTPQQLAATTVLLPDDHTQQEGGPGGGIYNLRETLLSVLFGNTAVMDTRARTDEALNTFRRLGVHPPCHFIALDDNVAEDSAELPAVQFGQLPRDVCIQNPLDERLIAVKALMDRNLAYIEEASAIQPGTACATPSGAASAIPSVSANDTLPETTNVVYPGINSSIPPEPASTTPAEAISAIPPETTEAPSAILFDTANDSLPEAAHPISPDGASATPPKTTRAVPPEASSAILLKTPRTTPLQAARAVLLKAACDIPLDAAGGMAPEAIRAILLKTANTILLEAARDIPLKTACGTVPLQACGTVPSEASGIVPYEACGTVPPEACGGTVPPQACSTVPLNSVRTIQPATGGAVLPGAAGERLDAPAGKEHDGAHPAADQVDGGADPSEVPGSQLLSLLVGLLCYKLSQTHLLHDPEVSRILLKLVDRLSVNASDAPPASKALAGSLCLPESYLNNPEVADTVFMVEGRPYLAVRIALLDNHKLKAMVDARASERSPVAIHGCSYAAWEVVMRFAHTGKVLVPSGVLLAAEVLVVADNYQMQRLAHACEHAVRTWLATVADEGREEDDEKDKFIKTDNLLAMYALARAMQNSGRLLAICMSSALQSWAKDVKIGRSFDGGRHMPRLTPDDDQLRSMVPTDLPVWLSSHLTTAREPEDEVRALLKHEVVTTLLIKMASDALDKQDGLHGPARARLCAGLAALMARVTSAKPGDAQQSDPPAGSFCLPDSYVNNAELADITFLVDGRTFHAVRIALLDASPAMKKWVVQNIKTSKESPIVVPDVSYAAWEFVMHYVHTRKTQKVPANLAAEVLTLATKHELTALADSCEAALAAALTTANLGEMLKLCRRENRRLQGACISFALHHWASGGSGGVLDMKWRVGWRLRHWLEDHLADGQVTPLELLTLAAEVLRIKLEDQRQKAERKAERDD